MDANSSVTYSALDLVWVASRPKGSLRSFKAMDRAGAGGFVRRSLASPRPLSDHVPLGNFLCQPEGPNRPTETNLTGLFANATPGVLVGSHCVWIQLGHGWMILHRSPYNAKMT